MHVCIQAGDRVVLVDGLIATGGTALASIHIHTCRHTHIHTYMHTYIPTYIHTHIAYEHTYMHACMHTGWGQSSIGRWPHSHRRYCAGLHTHTYIHTCMYAYRLGTE
jgi:hypothetical protein